MSKQRIAFITTTAVFTLAMLPGAVMDLTQPEMVVRVMETLGMPVYVLTLVGIWKLLGLVALARPRFRRINEWAYAGFFFDLTGAAFLHGAAGDTAGVPVPLIMLVLLVASYVLRGRVDRATSVGDERMG
ncbi:MAG: DoxX family protein [Nannocystaceae bacterium]